MTEPAKLCPECGQKMSLVIDEFVWRVDGGPMPGQPISATAAVMWYCECGYRDVDNAALERMEAFDRERTNQN